MLDIRYDYARGALASLRIISFTVLEPYIAIMTSSSLYANLLVFVDSLLLLVLALPSTQCHNKVGSFKSDFINLLALPNVRSCHERSICVFFDMSLVSLYGLPIALSGRSDQQMQQSLQRKRKEV